MCLSRMFVERGTRRSVNLSARTRISKKNQEDIIEDYQIFNVIADEELDSGRWILTV